jgi:glycosyltransferase involved in cell wall biosynthesis
MTETKPIALVTGSLPPDMCGVGDYTQRLYEELAPLAPVDLVHRPIRRLLEADLLRVFAGRRLVHVQYPSEGWGKSLMPGLLPLFRGRTKLLVTLHEWSIMHPLRKRAIAPLIRLADGFIFVSPLELREFERTASPAALRKPRWHIPIGINLSIPELSEQEVMAFRERELPGQERLVTHFGFVHPGKQPEKLLGMMSSLQKIGVRARLVFVGGFQAKTGALEQELRAESERLGVAGSVIWRGFVEDEHEAALWMSASDANISLFDDGVSARRGSFWYASQHGCHVITTEPQDGMEFAGLEALSPPHVTLVRPDVDAERLAQIVRDLPPFRPFRFPPLPAPSWRSIAEAHAKVYGEMLRD